MIYKILQDINVIYHWTVLLKYFSAMISVLYKSVVYYSLFLRHLIVKSYKNAVINTLEKTYMLIYTNILKGNLNTL